MTMGFTPGVGPHAASRVGRTVSRAADLPRADQLARAWAAVHDAQRLA